MQIIWEFANSQEYGYENMLSGKSTSCTQGLEKGSNLLMR